MKLGTLHTIFSRLDNEDFVFKVAFVDPQSYRGYYDELAFTDGEKVSLRDVKISVNRAITEEFEGYKGGTFEYDYSTPVHLAAYGNYSDDSTDIFEALVGKMLTEYLSNN